MLSVFVFLLSLTVLSIARPAVRHDEAALIASAQDLTARALVLRSPAGPIRKTTKTSTIRTSTTSTSTARSSTTSTSTTSTSTTSTSTTSTSTTSTSTTSTSTTSTSTTSTSTTSTSSTTSTTSSTSSSTSSTSSTTGYASTTTFSFAGNTLPSGLAASTWTVPTTPQPHQFSPQNAYVSGGYLNLVVPGGQSNSTTIQAGEVSTTFTVSSASVETYAMLSSVAGVCNGMFYYEGRYQESDIEWLSSSQSKANVQSGEGRAMFYTNQPAAPGNSVTQRAGPAPMNPTATVHNYQLVWISGVSTNFYIDGKFQTTLTTNVANATDGRWFWNNWSSGDPYWSAGPPLNTAVFKIQKIVMRYNPGS